MKIVCDYKHKILYIGSTIDIGRNLIIIFNISLPARVEINYRLANQSDLLW